MGCHRGSRSIQVDLGGSRWIFAVIVTLVRAYEKVAVTKGSEPVVTTHGAVPLQVGTSHPRNCTGGSASASNVTGVSGAYASLQSVGQLIPEGVLLTVADSSPPEIDTVRIGHVLKVAVTVFEASIVTSHGSAAHAPLHPAKIEVRFGLAVSVTIVPWL
jgi:hypothetical protein